MEENELADFKELNLVRNNDFEVNRQQRNFTTQQSPIISNLEQGSDFQQDFHGNQRISSLMEPLLEQENEEEIKSGMMKPTNNRVSTCTSYTLESKSRLSSSLDTQTPHPEDIFNNNFHPSK